MKLEKLMSVAIFMSLIAVFIVLFVVVGVSTACDCTVNMDSVSMMGMANPAAVYCEELGYQYNILTDNEGGQQGICVFPDNSSCDEWGFFTGKCGQNYSWCAVNGCGIKTVSDGRNQYSPEYAVCILPNKTTEQVTRMMKMDEIFPVDAIKADYLNINVSTIMSENSENAAANPITFSWKNKDGQDWITPVKSQRCGSCWAFAAVGAVEAKINIARNDSNFDPDLAEHYLVSDCCEYCGDCGGGSSSSALMFIKEEGISDEPCFPTTGSDCPCSFRCSTWNKRLWKIDDYDSVPSGRENMKRYLIERGPLVVSMTMSGYFDSNGLYRCSDYHSAHAVVIVGYDDTEGCWIAKNSWGSSYQDHGYFKVGYGECGIENYPRYIDLAKEQTEDFRVDNVDIDTGSKSGDLNDTYYKDGDYITLSEKCYVTSCDGLNAIINLSVNSLQNITSMELLAHHRARGEGGFSLQYWDENSDQWVSLGGIPESTWYLMKYKICNSKSECASYLSSGNVLLRYYHPSCFLCDTDYVDIDWLYLEAYPEKFYCDASTNNANYMWINRVALNTNERISGSSTYSNYTSEVLTTLNRGETYTLQVDGHTTGYYPEFVKAWIDFNNDKDFNDDDEEINLGNYTFAGTHTFNGQFKVPLDTDLSDTRMRVYFKYQNEPQACENASYGEVEDYKIRISSAALFTDNYFDSGIDIDEPPNGYYDYLAIDVGVNVNKAGSYSISGSLYNSSGSSVDFVSNDVTLNAGNQTVQLRFNGAYIWQSRTNDTFDLRFLRLYDASNWSQLDYRYNTYTTDTYIYTDFRPPAVLMPDIRDYGYDENGNGLYDYLIIEKQIFVTTAGNYELEGFLSNGSGYWIDSDYNYTYLSAGTHNLTLKFRGETIYNSQSSGNFVVNMFLYGYSTSSLPISTDLEHVENSFEENNGIIKPKLTEIVDANISSQNIKPLTISSQQPVGVNTYRWLDSAKSLTSYYSYTQFEQPPGEFNNIFTDYGVDTNSDGLYNYLVINAGVKVNEAGDFRISGYLYDEQSHQVDSDHNITFLDTGNQTVQLKFEGIKIRQNIVNGTFDVSLYLYNYSTGDSFNHRYYTTSHYNYTDFQIPSAEFDDVYSDYGEDVDGDGLYDYLVVNVGVDVREAGNYQMSGQLNENGTYNYIDYDSDTTYLNEGTQTVQLRFEGLNIRNNEYNGTYDLRYLYLYDANYPTPTPVPTPMPTPTATPTPTSVQLYKSELKSWESSPVGYGELLDYRYYAYTTSYYHYIEFQLPIPDAYEPDDDYSLANYISINDTKQIHNFHVPDDHDWLKFNASGGNAYTIETSDLGPASDTYLYLYDPDGTTEIEHDDDSGVGLASKIIWNCNASCMYYIKIRHYNSLAYGQETGYNVSVNQLGAIPIIEYFMDAVDDSASESGDTATIRFWSEQNLSSGVIVDGWQKMSYSIGGTATNGIDYEYLTGEVYVEIGVGIYIPPDDAPHEEIIIKPLADTIIEGNETVEITFGESTETITIADSAPPNISWNVTISATNQLEPVVVGMHPNATDDYDPAFDDLSQTPVQGKVILILDDLYSRKIKKTRCYGESVSWNLSLGVPAGQTTTLSWVVPSNVNLTIIEGDTVSMSGSQFGEGSHELTVTAELLEEYPEFCIDLKAGWNMVSIPVIPDNSSVQELFSSIPTLNTMPVKTWVSPLFVTVDEIEPQKGYWVFTPTATTICVGEKPITDTTLNLKAGWNMVGTVCLENMTIAAIPNQVSICPAVTWSSPSFVETDVIEPGKAAWVFVTQDTVGAVSEGSPKGMKIGMASVVTTKTSTIQASSEEWNLTISATNQLEPVTFGIAPDATDGYDAGYDTFAQTPVQGKVILLLDNIYAKEINSERMTWNLSVGVPTGETATLSWEPSKIPTTMVLTVDGTDMNAENSLLLDEGSHSFVIEGTLVTDDEPPAAPIISSSTHPNENLTYCNANPVFSWTTPADPSGIACFSYALDHLALTAPDETCDTTGATKSYTNLTSDTWYFHVRAKDNANNWGPSAHYRVQIENCNIYDGCYAYETGCEDRDYYSNGTSCTYTFSNRHSDTYDDWVYFCSGDTVRKHRLL